MQKPLLSHFCWEGGGKAKYQRYLKWPTAFLGQASLGLALSSLAEILGSGCACLLPGFRPLPRALRITIAQLQSHSGLGSKFKWTVRLLGSHGDPLGGHHSPSSAGLQSSLAGWQVLVVGSCLAGSKTRDLPQNLVAGESWLIRGTEPRDLPATKKWSKLGGTRKLLARRQSYYGKLMSLSKNLACIYSQKYPNISTIICLYGCCLDTSWPFLSSLSYSVTSICWWNHVRSSTITRKA